MYGNGKFIKLVDPLGAYIDTKLAEQSPNTAAQFGVPGSPGKEKAKQQIQQKQQADRAAFELRLRTLYPDAFGQTSTQAPGSMGDIFSTELEQKKPKSIF